MSAVEAIDLAAATAQHDAELATRYGDAVPDYKAPGSDEHMRAVQSLAEWIADRRRWDADEHPELLPLAVGFLPVELEPAELVTDPDQPARVQFRTALGLRPVSEHLAARLGIDVDNVSARHDQHRDCRHPHCLPCEERHGGGLDGVDATSAELIRGELRTLVQLRLYRWLASGRHVQLDVRAPVEAETTNPWATLDELAAQEPPAMLVDGLLPSSAIGYLIGRDGTGKTFAALDLALSLLTGQAFHGRNTAANTGVLFVAAEGAASFPQRIAAWELHHRRPLTTDEREALTIRTAAVDLFADGPDVAELIERCEAEAPSLVVFDTLRRCAGAADQNSAADMGRITDVLERVKRASGGTVLVIAHTGKSDEDTRGSSAIEDDADFVLHMKSDGRTSRLMVTKQKDGSTDTDLTLYPRKVAGSLVLADEADPLLATVWSSSDPMSRVLGAVRELAPLGPATQSQIVSQADGLAQSTASRALADLVKAGQVVRVGPAGRGARYGLPAGGLDGAVDEVI